MNEHTPINPNEPNPDECSQNPEPLASAIDEGLPSQRKKEHDWVKKAGIVFFAGVFFWIIASLFFHSDKKIDTAEKQKQAQEKIRPRYNTPQKMDTVVESSPMVDKTPTTTETTAAPQKVPTQEETELLKMKIAYLQQQQKIYQMRLKAPIELWEGRSNTSGVTGNASPSSASLSSTAYQPLHSGSTLPLTASQIDALKKAQQGNTGDSNTDFQAHASHKTTTRVQATHIPYRDETITEGTMIAGVLQTAINSDLPGMIKANVSEDVYGSTGEKLLIPKGSTLIGQYNSNVGLGQKRVFVMWTRLIRPDGVDVLLGSPGTDNLGTAGLGADVLQTHFWERFGQSALLSIISASIANAGVPEDEAYNSASQYRMMMSANFQQSANATLNNTMNQKPTLYLHQGDKIKVFVSRDLSFHDASLEAKE